MWERAELTAYAGRVEVVEPGGAPGAASAASVEPGDEAVSIVLQTGAPVQLPYTDIDDLFDDDHTLRLTDCTGRRYDLSMLGKAYGQVVAEIAKRRRDLLQRDLLLTGVGDPEPFPGAVGGEGGPAPVELRLFDDLLVVLPERGTPWGLPFSFVERVEWDGERYEVRVTDDRGTVHVFGRLARRSEEFRDDLRARLDALARRTASTLASLLPGLEPAALSSLAAAMRDGRAVQQRAVDAIDPAIWPRLEAAVVGEGDRRASYETLKGMTPPGWAAVGVKAVEAEDAVDGDADPAGAGQGGPESGRPGADGAITWFFCPLARDGRPVNAVAQEVTSESGHATYLFRLLDPASFAASGEEALAAAVAAGVARLNRALLTLNFRRRPIYLPEDQIREGAHARYRVALRTLDELRWARRAFLGRAIHTDEAAWRAQVERAVGEA